MSVRHLLHVVGAVVGAVGVAMLSGAVVALLDLVQHGQTLGHGIGIGLRSGVRIGPKRRSDVLRPQSRSQIAPD